MPTALVPELAVRDWHEAVAHTAVEDRWYRRVDREVGHRQFVVADPDGSLRRFYQALGERGAPAEG